jgi:Bacterial pre-peptidase C-terminal domain
MFESSPFSSASTTLNPSLIPSGTPSNTSTLSPPNPGLTAALTASASADVGPSAVPIFSTGNTNVINLGTLQGQRTYGGTVTGTGNRNLYQFTITSSTNVSIYLGGTGGDADLFLFDGQNNQLKASTTAGSNQEFLSVTGLAAGTYYADVLELGIGSTSYNLSLIADNANTGTTALINVGALQGQQTYSGNVIGNGSNNYYQFTLDAPSTALSAVLSGIGGDADLYLYQAGQANALKFSARDGNLESFDITGLAAGTYYANVYEYGLSNTSYNLTLTADAAGSSGQARNLGLLNGAATFKDFVGNSDPLDVYRFQLTGAANTVAIGLRDLTADADIYVYRDANNNGIADTGEFVSYSYNSGTTPETLYLQGLGSGSYLVEVYQYSGNTNYTLDLTPLSGNNGTSLSTPVDLGTVTISRSVTGNLTASDGLDYYRFSLNTTSNLSVNLAGLSSPANGLLIRDTNNDGVFDAGDTVQQVFFGNGTVNLAGLAAGNYFVGMFRNGGDTSYTLSLTPDSAGNSLFTARDLGSNIGRTVTDAIGLADGIDYYRFTLTSTSAVDIGISGLGADLDLAVVRDYNGNGGVDPGEVLLQSFNRGNTADRVTGTLAPGTYYIQVNPFISGASSTYKLGLGITPV